MRYGIYLQGQFHFLKKKKVLVIFFGLQHVQITKYSFIKNLNPDDACWNFFYRQNQYRLHSSCNRIVTWKKGFKGTFTVHSFYSFKCQSWCSQIGIRRILMHNFNLMLQITMFYVKETCDMFCLPRNMNKKLHILI